MASAESPRDHENSPQSGVSRRAVALGSAWAVPAVALAVAVPGASASTPPDPCPTFDPCGLYGSSGSVIFRYSGNPANTGGGFTVNENSGQFAGSYWSSNLAIGPYVSPTCTDPVFVFYGSRYNNSYLNVYRALAGATGQPPAVEVVGPVPSGPVSGVWGGMACDTAGDIWMISNLTALSATTIARANPQTASTLTTSFVRSGGGLVGGGANARVAASGTVIPDITFTPDKRMFGLIYSTAAGSSGQVWLCEYLTGTLAAGAPMTIEPLVRVTGPVATASTSIYGFAWLGATGVAEEGVFYAVNGGNGLLYRIDPATGVSSAAGTKTSPATYDYAATDLASAPFPGCTI